MSVLVPVKSKAITLASHEDVPRQADVESFKSCLRLLDNSMFAHIPTLGGGWPAVGEMIQKRRINTDMIRNSNLKGPKCSKKVLCQPSICR